MAENKMGPGAYVIGGLSFIPLLGVVFGIISIIWGLASKSLGGKWLALIGLCGILFTCLIYGLIFYNGFMVRGGVYDELRAEMAQEFLMSSLDVIESYKSRNGHYPESLEVLAETLPADSMQRLSLTDPTLVGGAQMLLYYERVGESEYRLLARGPDGEPFTQDDITLPGPFRGYGLTN